MDDETRRAVDEACLRLMGWTELEWHDPPGEFTIRCPGAPGTRSILKRPSTTPVLVVPLAEALIGAGWEMGEIKWDVRGFRVTLMTRRGKDVEGEWAPTMQEAIAVAAAKAQAISPV